MILPERNAVMHDNGTPPLTVALNTWLLLRTCDQGREPRPMGGLPNDFLTKGAATLLLVDHVVCDEEGLASEGVNPWVSTRLFERLREAKLLQPRPYRTMLSADVLEHLDAGGLFALARSLMASELGRIERGEVATEGLTLPPLLRWINSVMFTGIDEPATLHYDYHDAYFANVSLTSQEILRELGPSLRETAVSQEHSRKTARLLEALSILVPDFSLLPRIATTAGRAALRENLREEKRMLFRYIYGGMPREEYERFRRTDDFNRRDAIVDSDERIRQAERNLDVLLRVREQTAEVRRFAQKRIRAVIDGRREIDDVRQELRFARGWIEEALEKERGTRSLRVVGGAEALLGLAHLGEVLLPHQRQEQLELHLFEAVHAFAGVAAERFGERSGMRELLASIGRRFPLAWIAAAHRRERDDLALRR